MISVFKIIVNNRIKSIFNKLIMLKIFNEFYLIIRNLFDEWIFSGLLKYIESSFVFFYKFFSFFSVVILLTVVNNYIF